MAVLWRIDLAGDVDWREKSQRGVARAQKAGLLAMGTEWKQKYLPLHFQPGNRERYSLQPRTPQYLKRKLRAGDRKKNARGRSRASFTKVALGGAVDLVYTGLMRRQVTKHAKIRSFPTRCTVVITGPSYFTRRPKNPKHPNLALEVVRLIPEELDELRKTAARVAVETLSRSRGPGRPRKKIP